MSQIPPNSASKWTPSVMGGVDWHTQKEKVAYSSPLVLQDTNLRILGRLNLTPRSKEWPNFRAVSFHGSSTVTIIERDTDEPLSFPR